jgi:hypothetical protein
VRFAVGYLALSLAIQVAGPSRALAQAVGSRVASFATFSGSVVDSAGRPIEGVEVALTDLRRVVLSGSTGSFRFDSVPVGQWIVRVRRIGFAAETRSVDVDTGRAPVEFRLRATVRTLVPIVTSASRLGLGGTVNDASGKPVPKARVRVLGSGLETITDSAGQFWIAARSGSYMVAVAKTSFAERIAGVTIPPDSGREVTIWLRPSSTVPVREAWNIEDLRERMAWVKQSGEGILTRDAMAKDGYDLIYDVVQAAWVRMGRKHSVSPECRLVVNGGPATVALARITVDDVESIEIYSRYPKTSAAVAAAAPRRGSIGGGQFVQLSNTRAAEMANGGMPCLAVYVWMR